MSERVSPEAAEALMAEARARGATVSLAKSAWVPPDDDHLIIQESGGQTRIYSLGVGGADPWLWSRAERPECQ